MFYLVIAAILGGVGTESFEPSEMTKGVLQQYSQEEFEKFSEVLGSWERECKKHHPEPIFTRLFRIRSKTGRYCGFCFMEKTWGNNQKVTKSKFHQVCLPSTNQKKPILFVILHMPMTDHPAILQVENLQECLVEFNMHTHKWKVCLTILVRTIHWHLMLALTLILVNKKQPKSCSFCKEKAVLGTKQMSTWGQTGRYSGFH